VYCNRHRARVHVCRVGLYVGRQRLRERFHGRNLCARCARMLLRSIIAAVLGQHAGMPEWRVRRVQPGHDAVLRERRRDVRRERPVAKCYGVPVFDAVLYSGRLHRVAELSGWRACIELVRAHRRKLLRKRGGGRRHLLSNLYE
jgi:hypothetical protein